MAGIGDLGPYWKATARGRHFRLQAVAAMRQGGFILDCKAFSDLSLNLLVESSGSGVVALADSLVALGCPVGVDPGREALGALAHPQPAVPG